MSALLIDAKVLTAIRKINGLAEERRAGAMAHAIRMNKGMLNSFVQNPGHTLKRFKIRGFGVTKQRIRKNFRGSMIDFELALILPKQQLKHTLQPNLNFFETPKPREKPTA